LRGGGREVAFDQQRGRPKYINTDEEHPPSAAGTPNSLFGNILILKPGMSRPDALFLDIGAAPAGWEEMSAQDKRDACNKLISTEWAARIAPLLRWWQWFMTKYTDSLDIKLPETVGEARPAMLRAVTELAQAAQRGLLTIESQVQDVRALLVDKERQDIAWRVWKLIRILRMMMLDTDDKEQAKVRAQELAGDGGGRFLQLCQPYWPGRLQSICERLAQTVKLRPATPFPPSFACLPLSLRVFHSLSLCVSLSLPLSSSFSSLLLSFFPLLSLFLSHSLSLSESLSLSGQRGSCCSC